MRGIAPMATPPAATTSPDVNLSIKERFPAIKRRIPTSIRSSHIADVIVAGLFGLWSMFRGLDINEDLYAYHLYNPFALLNKEPLVDLAPAGFQSYFNPFLDVPYYVLGQLLPAPLVGFLFGAFHGSAFALVNSIARSCLPRLPEAERIRTSLLLAAAGALTLNFLGELGTSMGDNTSAIFALAGTALLLSRFTSIESGEAKGRSTLFSIGLLFGLATGLKLTNAVFAFALIAALAVVYVKQKPLLQKLALCCAGLAIGFLLTGSYWMLQLYESFGNPLFPQFSRFFPNPLAASVGVLDTRWGPKSLWEAVAWPFVISIDARRVGEADVRQIIWGLLYGMGLATLAYVVAKRVKVSLDARQVFVLMFVIFGFIAWTTLFSIYRYLVVIEVLAPLAVYLLLNDVAQLRYAKVAAAGLLVVASLVVVTGGVADYGHASWTAKPYRVAVPPLADPERTTVLLLGDKPFAWLAAFFPATVAFISVNGNFPATPYYHAYARAYATRRGDEVFALIAGDYDSRARSVARIQKIAGQLGVLESRKSCDLVEKIVVKFRLRMRVVEPRSDGHRQCTILPRPQDLHDVAAANSRLAERAKRILEPFGFELALDQCDAYEAYAGDALTAYQMCRVKDRR